MSALLEVVELSGSYGSAQALHGVSFDVQAGQMLALMGRNGMGKTSTVRGICRMLPQGSGTVRFAGQDLTGLASHHVARLGIGLVPEGRRCFPNLTVTENLLAAARPGAWGAAEVETLFPRLLERRGQMAATLSGGEQQMLAIGRALMTNPKLLILDEATEGLAPVIRAEIWAAIAKLKGDGLSILVIDKTLSDLLAHASDCVILERGKSVWQGAPETLTGAIAGRYLGV